MNMQSLKQQAWRTTISAIALVLGLCLPVHAATTRTVCSTCTGTNQYQTISAALAAAVNGDTINVYANTAGYAEQITITKRVTLNGLTSSGQPAWGTAAGNSNGPVIKYINGYPQMMSFQANYIEMKGFALESITGGTPLNTVNCINMEGPAPLKGITMTYNTFTMGPKRNGVAVDNGRSLQNATMSYCKFIGTITAATNWFFVGEGSPSVSGDGGAINSITLTSNNLNHTTSRLQLDNSIKNLTYSLNTFNDSNGYILLEEPTDQATYKFEKIKILTNTFNDSTTPFPNEYAVVVASNVENGDVATSWTTDLVINYNKFLQGDAGGSYPIVGFQDNGATTDYTTPINAQFNWWNNRQGPRSFDDVDVSGSPSTTPDITLKTTGNRAYVDYSPWMGKTFATTLTSMDWYTNDEIQPAIDAASIGDTINVISNTTAYREPLNINKTLTLIGRKTNFAIAQGTVGYDSGPIIKYDDTHSDMIKFNASNIAMEGFKIDTAVGATTTKGVYFNGTISNPTITYCTFTMGDQGDRGISVDSGATVKNATISNCSFIGAITNCSWFIVDGSAGGAGGLEGATLSNNKIEGATSELQLNKTIKEVTYTYNTFDNANGYIKLSEPVEQSTNKFSNIKFYTNTFNPSKRPSEYAVLVSANVDYNDVASNDWSNLMLSFNKFWQTDRGGIYPNVGFETVSDQITTKINAKENWWGTSLGPTRATETKTKVRISQMVDFQPWLGSKDTSKNTEYVRFNDGAQDMVLSDTIQGALDASPISGGGSIFVKPGYYDETLNIQQQNIKLIGKKSDGTTNAWTNNTVGSSADAPVIRGIVKLGTDKIELKGFNLDTSNTSYAVYAGSPISPITISAISITYCTFSLGNSDRGVEIDNGNTTKDLLVGYCKFTGASNSSWFYIGDGINGGSIDTGAWGYGARLLHNDITQASADLRLGRSIKNVQFTNNTFNNTANGYITLEKPATKAPSALIQGITITHNTFNNSTTAGFTNEYAVVVMDTIEETDTNVWDKNLTLYFNNFLQDDAGSIFYPTVGFEDSSLYTTAIDTRHNWWNSTSGPRSFEFDTGVSTIPDVSLNAGFDPDHRELYNYSRAKILGGVADMINPGITRTITDTSINVDLTVKTNGNGPAPVFAAKYNGNPIAITKILPSGDVSNSDAFYDILVYPSSAGNIDKITATFSFSASDSSVYWYNITSTSWVPWGASYKKTVSGKPQIWATASSWPPISQLIGTPICIKGAGTATTSVPGSTTTSVNSATTAATSTTTSAAVTTTTSIGGTTTAKTTSSVKPTTTTTAPQPKLTINPGSLNYGADKIVQTFTITNTGPGTLSWNINKEGINYDQGVGWIFDITPASGETNKEQDTVAVTISRAELLPGTFTATIPISSNGGDKSLSISMEVTAAEAPVLKLNPTVLYLKETDAAGTVDISNAGTGTLVWKLGDPVYVNGNGINWISGVTPPSGSTAQEKATVSISVNRDNLRGGIYIANISLTSNVGNRTIGVVMFVARDSQQYPRTKVDPFILFLKKSDVSKTFNISNDGTGTLVWQLGDVTYPPRQQGSWITAVSPQAGEASSDVDTITVTVDSSSLKQGGLYGATIPVKSNGGNRNVFIYVWVPLLQLE